MRNAGAIVREFGRVVCAVCHDKGKRPDFDVRMLQQQFKSVQAELARLRKKIDQLEVVKMGKHSAFESDLDEARDIVRTEMASAVAAENELDAVWRRALEEAVIVLQELDAKIGEGAEAEGMSAAVEASARLTLTTAEQLLNALRLRGRPRDER